MAVPRTGEFGSLGRYDAAVPPSGSVPTTGGPTQAAPRTLLLSITGMTCEHCQRHVTEALTSVDGVADATVDLERGVATVALRAPVPDAELCIAVEGAGYEASVLEGPRGDP